METVILDLIGCLESWNMMQFRNRMEMTIEIENAMWKSLTSHVFSFEKRNW